jgi:hypothetical protein
MSDPKFPSELFIARFTQSLSAYTLKSIERVLAHLISPSLSKSNSPCPAGGLPSSPATIALVSWMSRITLPRHRSPCGKPYSRSSAVQPKGISVHEPGSWRHGAILAPLQGAHESHAYMTRGVAPGCCTPALSAPEPRVNRAIMRASPTD